MAEDLTNGSLSDDDKKALKKLYKSMRIEDYQPPSDKNRVKQLKTDIKKDKEIQAAKAKWNTLSDKEREKTLQKVADYHSVAYDLPKKDLVFEDLGDMKSFGYFSPSKNTVVVSNYVDPSTGQKILDDADEAFDTVVHENTHRYQKDLVNKLNNGEIHESDDRHNQARLMRANDKWYCPPDEDSEAYIHQPKEAHAWKVGRATKETVMSRFAHFFSL